MPSKAFRETRAERVAAPATQNKMMRLTPNYALAWLHLLPSSAFPIRSRDDMATKISALLIGGEARAETPKGHGLPAQAQSQTGKRRGAR